MLIFIISAISQYSIPDLNQANWDTVLFLTPYGIINNYLNKESSVLWTFYSDVSDGQNKLSLINFLMIAAVYVLLLLNVYNFFKTFFNLKSKIK